MWNGGLLTSREPCCRDQKTKMRVVVDVIFVQILTGLQLMKHRCMQIDNLHKNYIKFIQGGVFFNNFTVCVHFCIFKKG